MSGFFGIMRTDGTAVEPRFLEMIAQRLRFRGPDGAQTWAKDGLGTCFAYLETGTRYQSRSQPIQLGERYTLVGEVRLDTRKELIPELLEKERRAIEEFSDEELLLLAWSVWGEGALAKLLGDFSFGIWDASQQIRPGWIRESGGRCRENLISQKREARLQNSRAGPLCLQGN